MAGSPCLAWRFGDFRLPKRCTSSPVSVQGVSRNGALRLLFRCRASPETVHPHSGLIESVRSPLSVIPYRARYVEHGYTLLPQCPQAFSQLYNPLQ
jgi:hypothetical protein